MGVKSYSIASEQWGWLEYDLKRITSILREARTASKRWLDFWKETKNILFEFGWISYYSMNRVMYLFCLQHLSQPSVEMLEKLLL